jgi:catechol 2,3-dioxygenase-like lactoylglutathione lyase family enzyme
MLMNGTGVDQVGILVPDLEAGVEKYSKLLHITSWIGYTYGPALVPNLVYRGEPATYSYRIALGGTSPQIELIEPPEGPSFYREWVEDQGFGQHHLGMFVPSVHMAMTDMTAAGYQILQSGSGYGIGGDGGFAYFDTRDDLGAILEAIEVPKQRRPPDFRWD